MLSNINEITLDFTQLEMDGYMLAGYMAISNAVLQDDSDLQLLTSILNAMGVFFSIFISSWPLFSLSTLFRQHGGARTGQADPKQENGGFRFQAAYTGQYRNGNAHGQGHGLENDRNDLTNRLLFHIFFLLESFSIQIDYLLALYILQVYSGC